MTRCTSSSMPRTTRAPRVIGEWTDFFWPPVHNDSTRDGTYWWARVSLADIRAGTGGADYHGVKYQFSSTTARDIRIRPLAGSRNPGMMDALAWFSQTTLPGTTRPGARRAGNTWSFTSSTPRGLPTDITRIPLSSGSQEKLTRWADTCAISGSRPFSFCPSMRWVPRIRGATIRPSSMPSRRPRRPRRPQGAGRRLSSKRLGATPRRCLQSRRQRRQHFVGSGARQLL